MVRLLRHVKLYLIGILFNKQDSLTVIYQMKIHGILSAQRVVLGNCICNLTMCFDCLFVQSPTGCFNNSGIELLMTGIRRGTTTFLLLNAMAVWNSMSFCV